jgi:hypothetical protein
MAQRLKGKKKKNTFTHLGLCTIAPLSLCAVAPFIIKQ